MMHLLVVDVDGVAYHNCLITILIIKLNTFFSLLVFNNALKTMVMIIYSKVSLLRLVHLYHAPHGTSGQYLA